MLTSSPESPIPLIYNPGAGGRCGHKVKKAIGIMEGMGASVKPIETTGPGSAIGLAREAAAAGPKRLIVAGGDGTINEAINGMAGSGVELAILPMGTANVLAIELGLPANLDEACRIALSDQTAAIDLGLAGERYFALMAGFGFDALVIKNINPILKKSIRRAAFPIAGVVTYIKADLPLLTVKTPEREVEGYFVVAANSRYYGGRFGVTPEASMSDGLLDIFVLKKNSFAEMVNFWLQALASGTLDREQAEYLRVSEALVTCAEGAHVPVQTDGDVIGELPMRVSIAPAALKICRGEPA